MRKIYKSFALFFVKMNLLKILFGRELSQEDIRRAKFCDIDTRSASAWDTIIIADRKLILVKKSKTKFYTNEKFGRIEYELNRFYNKKGLIIDQEYSKSYIGKNYRVYEMVHKHFDPPGTWIPKQVWKD